MIEQCAWCNMILSGARKGERAPLLQEASHGLCDACAFKMRARYFARIACRLAQLSLPFAAASNAAQNTHLLTKYNAIGYTSS